MYSSFVNECLVKMSFCQMLTSMTLLKRLILTKKDTKIVSVMKRYKRAFEVMLREDVYLKEPFQCTVTTVRLSLV